MLAIKHDGIFDALPGPDHLFTADEKLLVLGNRESVQKMMK